MSKYQTLAIQERNAYISPFATSSIVFGDNSQYPVTPANPDANPIPSALAPDQRFGWKGPSPYPPRAGSIYGPMSTAHASLRYYGVGPY